MDWNYYLEKGWFYVDLENGKKYRVKEEEIRKSMEQLEISDFEAVEMWLEDNDILVNDEVEELTQKAKENKSTNVQAKAEKPKRKTQKERTRKENPTKEKIIAELAQFIPTIGAENVVVENVGKIITFTMAGNEYKIDLVQKRAKKAEDVA